MKTNTIIITICLFSQALSGQLMSIKLYEKAFSDTNQIERTEPRLIDFPDSHKIEAEWAFYFNTFEKLTDLGEDFLSVKSPIKNAYVSFEPNQASPIAHKKEDRQQDIACKLKLIEWQRTMSNPIIWEE
jgi:hypothetical protein